MSGNGQETRCGFVALVGRPNVGKSTLLNALLGHKVSIVTRKPQTTRHRIIGVHNLDRAQIVYVDTPGLHRDRGTALNRVLNRTAEQVLADVELAVFVVDAQRWTEEDDLVVKRLGSSRIPLLVALNKVDRVRDKKALLPTIARLQSLLEPSAIVPVSAVSRDNLQALENEVIARLPESPRLFPDDQVTDRGERFRAAELVREQIMATLGEELPYATTVEIEAFESEGRLRRVAAVIWVERPGQKSIVIGRAGARLKQIGTAARREMEQQLDARVHLDLWVKVREGWSDDERALKSLGYMEFD